MGGRIIFFEHAAGRATMKDMKVLFAASELSPMVKVGGLGDVIEALPKRLRASGVDVRIILPRYAFIERDTLELIAEHIPVRERDHGYCKSIYASDPDGLLVEFTSDPPDVDRINVWQRDTAHATLKRWAAGDRKANNNIRPHR